MSAGERRGHLLALFTIMVWGTTFLSTSVLLRDFTPLEILIIRMGLGIAALTVARPRRLRLKNRRHEWLFAGAGLTGVSMYFLLENYALTFTYSANCSVIISTAPFFVAIAVQAVPGRRADGAQLLCWLCGGHRGHRAFVLQRAGTQPQPPG